MVFPKGSYVFRYSAVKVDNYINTSLFSEKVYGCFSVYPIRDLAKKACNDFFLKHKVGETLQMFLIFDQTFTIISIFIDLIIPMPYF